MNTLEKIVSFAVSSVLIVYAGYYLYQGVFQKDAGQKNKERAHEMCETLKQKGLAFMKNQECQK
ncbi:hypothetical protein [Helicobacter felis]|uniref:Uncharacterized protein n=1 Tax=Helicobacter felis (strain ATCC 49179 / CCUG 28539 / NCTC 12436 / CS1) TaxID=936155 RepID=E7ACQ4_HELFC|nr:hypothetical protein [Helicobacter felis]CBY82234.1 putative uncharacterized protein [Helicobacter felis ATCC 49179]